MSELLAPISVWDHHHDQFRHQLRYPSEEVVRFLARAHNDGATTFLDIGCGAGRHMKLAAELGLQATGCDASPVAAKQAAQYGTTSVASMTDLPYEDDQFDVVLSWGVFYYGTLPQMSQALAEMRRVTRTWGLVNLRTTRDWRYGLGAHIDDWPHTYRFVSRGEPEDGMLLTFLTDAQVTEAMQYPNINVELAERTTRNRLRTDSDWIITVHK